MMALLGALLAAAGRAGTVMFGISVLVFLIFFATPGADPAARLAGRGAGPEALAAVRMEYGLDRPLPVQYATLMRRLFISRDLTSFVARGQPVVPALWRAAPVTLSLVAGAALLWVAGGLAIGLLAAAARGRWIDRLLTGLGLLGVSVPAFWMGTVANMLTQDAWHDSWLFAWVPPPGYVPLGEDPAGWMRALAIPWFTLALLYAGLYGRVLRAALVAAYGEHYVRTARAKGLSEAQVLLRHALRPALVPFVSLLGLDLGALLGGGALLTEVVFGLRGVGKLTFDALRTLDMPMVMAAVLYASFLVVLVNVAVDLCNRALDPRAS